MSQTQLCENSLQCTSHIPDETVEKLEVQSGGAIKPGMTYFTATIDSNFFISQSQILSQSQYQDNRHKLELA